MKPIVKGATVMAVILDENTEQLNKTRESLVPVVTPWLRAYSECSDEIQAVVRDMLEIIASDSAEDDEKEMAAATVREALFPSNHNGALGADLVELETELKSHCPQCKQHLAEMDAEETTFSERVSALMKERGMTQEELAAASGVGQSAISMMLARKARPQKRTVVRIAKALAVEPPDLWPSMKGRE